MFTLLFPGQGSQQPGMGKFLFDNFPLAKQIFEEASDALSFDLKELCFNGSVADLALTENTQPALLVTSRATEQVLRTQFGVKTNAAAGHSIGEYAALVAAEAMPFAQAMKAVRIRGQAMQAAVPVGQGGMVAVLGLTSEQTEDLCQHVVKKSGFFPVSPANFNSPGQIVISGSQKALDWMKDNAKAEEIWPTLETKPRLKLIPLQVSAPFHCSMMKPAEDKMREVLTSIEFQNAKFSVVQNLDANSHKEAQILRENLIRQVSAPVKWMQSMETLKSAGQTLCVEAGAGKVLQGLLKKIDSESFKVFNTNTLEDLEMIEKFVKAST